jgi:hypothetical protein
MKLYIKYDGIVACRVICKNNWKIEYKIPVTRAGEIEINDGVPADVFAELQSSLNRYSIFYCKQRKVN